LDSEASRFYTVLGHPLRRRLLKVLGERRAVSFTDLKSALSVSVGTLYYNLDLMEGLVAQDMDKRYILTREGEVAYRLLIEGEEKLASLGVDAERPAGWMVFLSRVFILRGLFSYLYASPKLSLPSAITILIYGSWITYNAELLPIIILFSDKPTLPPLLTAALFIAGWAAINILGNLLPFILYRRPLAGAGCLIVGSSYAVLPSLTLPTIWVLCRTYVIPLSLLSARLLMLISAAYSLFLLTTAVSMAKGLRMEKAALVTMIVLYIAVGFALSLQL